MHESSSQIGGLVSCKHVFRKGIHSEVVLNEHLEKMLFTELSVRQVVRGFFRGRIIQSKCTFPHFVIGLVVPLLLPTPAIWFSLDHKRNVSDGVVSGIGTLFSLDYKLYTSDYDSDSDSIASENQPLKILNLIQSLVTPKIQMLQCCGQLYRSQNANFAQSSHYIADTSLYYRHIYLATYSFYLHNTIRTPL